MVTVSVSFHGFRIQMLSGVYRPGAKQTTAGISLVGKLLEGCQRHQLLRDLKRSFANSVTQSFCMSQSMQEEIPEILL